MNRGTAGTWAFVATVALAWIVIMAWIGQPVLVITATVLLTALPVLLVGLCGFAVWWVLTHLFMWLFR